MSRDQGMAPSALHPDMRPAQEGVIDALRGMLAVNDRMSRKGARVSASELRDAQQEFLAYAVRMAQHSTRVLELLDGDGRRR